MYEWDEAKNAANIAKHGVSFELARRIFDGPVLTLRDTRQDYGEIREISIGQVEGVAILVVVHTQREARRRLISARPASERERTRYAQALHQANDPG
jgi:uncharacterized DUF497 family protein